MAYNPLLPDSRVINGQLVGVRSNDAYNPTTLGPYYMGGTTPVPSAPPGAFGLGAMPTDGGGGVGNSQLTAAATANPWSPTVSPLPWVIVALIVGLLGLRYVHWKM